jgi:hypothetical protein
MLNILTGKEAKKFVANFEPLFKSLPHLPPGFIKFIVSIAPWIALLGGISSILTGFGLLDIDDLMELDPAAISTILEMVMGALLLLAFSPLRKKEFKGWMFLFWAAVINIVNLILVIFAYSTGIVGGSIVGVLVQLYLIFEIKSSYK